MRNSSSWIYVVSEKPAAGAFDTAEIVRMIPVKMIQPASTERVVMVALAF